MLSKVYLKFLASMRYSLTYRKMKKYNFVLSSRLTFPIQDLSFNTPNIGYVAQLSIESTDATQDLQ